jgi:hypothetical protein
MRLWRAHLDTAAMGMRIHGGEDVAGETPATATEKSEQTRDAPLAVLVALPLKMAAVSRCARRWWCAVVVLAALAAQGHKAQVNDPAVARAIVAEGGRLIADYGSYQLFETERTNGVQLRDDYNRVLLTAGSLDTSRPEMQRGRKPAGEFQGRRLHLVQFAGPVLPAWRQALIETGAQIVSYIPHNTYLVYGDAAALARVQSSAIPAIQWDGAYLDDYKTNAAARLGKADQFAIQLVADAAVNAATLQLLSPAARRHRVLNYVNVARRDFNPALECAEETMRTAGPDRGGKSVRHGAERGGVPGVAGGEGIHPGAIRGVGICRGRER